MSDDNNLEPPRIILIPVDHSEHVERAINWYTENLMRPNDLVQLVHVVELKYNTPSVAIGMEVAMLPMGDFDEQIQRALEKAKLLVKKYVDRLNEKGAKSKGFLRIDSKVGEALVAISKEHNVDVILIANRGEGILRRTFLGSVSDYILYHINKPVIIVPPKT